MYFISSDSLSTCVLLCYLPLQSVSHNSQKRPSRRSIAQSLLIRIPNPPTHSYTYFNILSNKVLVVDLNLSIPVGRANGSGCVICLRFDWMLLPQLCMYVWVCVSSAGLSRLPCPLSSILGPWKGRERLGVSINLCYYGTPQIIDYCSREFIV